VDSKSVFELPTSAVTVALPASAAERPHNACAAVDRYLLPAGTGLVVNFDLEKRFSRPRSQQQGSLRPRARRVAVLGVGAGGGRPPFLRFLMPNPAFGGQFGPENKLIEGQLT